MNQNDIKELKKYIRPSIGIFVFGIFCTVITLFILVKAVVGDNYDKTKEIITGSVGTIVGIVLIIAGVAKVNNCDKMIKHIEKNGSLQILLNDFKTGGRAFKDSLILGQTFLIGKRTGTIVTYSQLLQIYQYVHTTNAIEDTRTLKVVVQNNKNPIDLCSIPLRGKSDDEVIQVINFIVSKNPNVRVGYNNM